MDEAPVLPALMTTAEVAKVLQVNRSTLSRWRAAGIDGAMANDTVGYSYDELGRVAARTVNGVGRAVSYDTLGRLRTERRTWRRRHDTNRWPSDTDDEQLDESTLVIVRQWTFDGAGWLSNGDAALAASAAARAREHRDLAREAEDSNQDHEL